MGLQLFDLRHANGLKSCVENEIATPNLSSAWAILMLAFGSMDYTPLESRFHPVGDLQNVSNKRI